MLTQAEAFCTRPLFVTLLDDDTKHDNDDVTGGHGSGGDDDCYRADNDYGGDGSRLADDYFQNER